MILKYVTRTGFQPTLTFVNQILLDWHYLFTKDYSSAYMVSVLGIDTLYYK